MVKLKKSRKCFVQREPMPIFLNLGTLNLFCNFYLQNLRIKKGSLNLKLTYAKRVTPQEVICGILLTTSPLSALV